MDEKQVKKYIGRTITKEQLKDIEESECVEYVKSEGIPKFLPNHEKYRIMVKNWGDFAVHVKI